jgi:hypothetical protein
MKFWAFTLASIAAFFKLALANNEISQEDLALAAQANVPADVLSESDMQAALSIDGIDPQKVRSYNAAMQQLAAMEAGERNLQGTQCNLAYSGNIVVPGEVEGSVPCYDALNLPCAWDWHLLVLQAGTTYHIDVDRLTCGMDPAVVVFKGNGDGLQLSSWLQFDGDIGTMDFVVFRDDEEQDTCIPSGPYGDPNFYYTPAEAGEYTIGVLNYLGDFSGCPDGSMQY